MSFKTRISAAKSSHEAMEYLHLLAKLSSELGLGCNQESLGSADLDCTWIEQLYHQPLHCFDLRAFFWRDDFRWTYRSVTTDEIIFAEDLNLADDIVMTLQCYRYYYQLLGQHNYRDEAILCRGKTIADDLSFYQPQAEVEYENLHRTHTIYYQSSEELRNALKALLTELDQFISDLFASNAYNVPQRALIIEPFRLAPDVVSGKLPHLVELRSHLTIYRPPFKGSCARKLTYLIDRFEHGAKSQRPGLRALSRRLAKIEAMYSRAIRRAEHKFHCLSTAPHEAASDNASDN